VIPRSYTWFALALMFCCVGAKAQTAADTVSGLLAQGYQVVGTTVTSAGVGLFLQNAHKLFFSLVAETPTSPEVNTRYCKSVK
jgi:hypothetical protein